MARWPFGRKKKDEAAPEDSVAAETPDAVADAPAEDSVQAVIEHDAVDGDTGPFDGDTVEINDFDFSDFASGILDLGSMKIPLPKGSQVQVEMGENGPKRVHIVTTAGRITPVAFAAPKVSGQWEGASAELLEGIQSQGMTAEFEQGPWGREIVGTGPQNVMRMIGIDGPRWMLRFTCASPLDKSDEMATIARDVAARTFIYRGSEPILAGNSLPVVIPAQLVAQMQEQIKKRQQQQAQQDAVRKAQAAIAEQQKKQASSGSYDPEDAAAAMQRLREAINAQMSQPQQNSQDSDEKKQ